MTAPLAGLRMVITRAAGPGAERWGAVFEKHGADVAYLPLIEVVPPTDPGPLHAAIERLEEFDWVAFTSAHAVHALLDATGGEWPAGPRIAAVGTATAAALEELGRPADLLPPDERAQGLAAAMIEDLEPGRRVLLPRAADGRPELGERLQEAGHSVTSVIAYAKRLPAGAPGLARELFGSAPVGWVAFASPSSCRNLAVLFGATEWPRRRGELQAASIGPTTSTALRQLGVAPACEAARPDPEALADAVTAALASG